MSGTRHAFPLAMEPFDIDEVFRRLREVCRHLPKAAAFALRDEGYAAPFEQLVGAMISARTRDETTMKVAPALFARARTPAEVLALPEEDLRALLAPATFAEAKARQVREMSRMLLERFGGQVPEEPERLQELPGVGPKVAALVAGVAFGRPAISVDVHVHRVTNRWGYVQAATPEKTQQELYAKLPRRYWVEINERLVPFGKFICTGQRPKCSTCPLLSQCRQVGVKEWR